MIKIICPICKQEHIYGVAPWETASIIRTSYCADENARKMIRIDVRKKVGGYSPVNRVFTQFHGFRVNI